jgi:hypothetical protein
VIQALARVWRQPPREEDLVNFKHRPRRAVVVAVALVAGAAAVAYATAAVTSTPSTTIQACQNDTNGLLRVVSHPGDCRTGETPLSWNVQGPQGEQGPPGPPGPPGPAGAGGPLAYAHVLANGTLDTSRSSNNVLGVTRTLVTGSTGCGGTCGFPVYCVDLDVQPNNVVATVENSVVENPPPPPMPGFEFPTRSIVLGAVNATVRADLAASWGCSATTDAAVIVATGQAGSPFYVEFN